MLKEEIFFYLSSQNKKEIQKLYSRANALTEKTIGKKIFLRGLIEFSNICEKNCFYCGLRKDNTKLSRYCLSKEKMVSLALWIYNAGFGSIILQSGEVTDKKRIDQLIEIVYEIKEKTNNRLGITLCLGEMEKEIYREFFQAGAHRYLLRIETSNPMLYRSIHPENHSFTKRLKCLENLKSIGYQTGTGVMIGLPGQTIEDLTNDILFYKKLDIDMIGMGPYIPQKNTPLAKKKLTCTEQERLELSLKMVALSRLFLVDVNIAATWAMGTLHEKGREMALTVGANVLMPQLTPIKEQGYYLLYDGKLKKDSLAMSCSNSLEKLFKNIKKKVAVDEWGDPIHFFARQKGTVG